MIKKNKKLFTIIIIIFLSFLGYNFAKKVIDNKYYTVRLGTILPKKSIVLESQDTHGGPHGDGQTYKKIQLSKEGAENFTKYITETKKWCNVPIPPKTSVHLWDGEYNGTSYTAGKLGKNIPKNIKNGMFCFVNRKGLKVRNIPHKDIFNYTISIIDLDTNILYIYDLDI